MYGPAGPRYFHTDRLGHVRRLTDAHGATLATCTLDAFGVPIDVPEDQSLPFTFGAREYDAATGLYYFRARCYDPLLGRFLSVDPVDASLDQPATLNPYLFAFNAPTRYVDPWGTDATSAIARSVESMQGMGSSQLDAAKSLVDFSRDMAGKSNAMRPGGGLAGLFSKEDAARLAGEAEEAAIASRNAAQKLIQDYYNGARWPKAPNMYDQLASGTPAAAGPPAGVTRLAGAAEAGGAAAGAPGITRMGAAAEAGGASAGATRLAAPRAGGAAPASAAGTWLGKALGAAAVAWTASNVYQDPENWPVYVGEFTGGLAGGFAGGGFIGGMAGSFVGGKLGSGVVWVRDRMYPPKDVPADSRADRGRPGGSSGKPIDPELLARAQEALDQMIRKEAAGIAQVINERERQRAVADAMERIRQTQTAVDNQWINQNPWGDGMSVPQGNYPAGIDQQWLERQLQDAFRGSDFGGVPDFGALQSPFGP
jgi:RHS repeat-associated protein